MKKIFSYFPGILENPVPTIYELIELKKIIVGCNAISE